jgi:hypothetical protein
MKKLPVLILTLAAGLWAADFWTKPYTDWTDKEVQKIRENSPWAKEFNIAIPSAGGDPAGASGGKGGKGGQNSPVGGPDAGAVGSGVNLVIRWQSALPVKEANVKMKYKAEAATSAEAKQLLDAAEPVYVLVIEGIGRGLVRGDTEQAKQEMMAQTALIVKGREPIKPVDFRLAGGQGKATAVFAFPKSTPITLDDKEVEFDCKVGTFSVKQKFQLKAMVFNGKLEL